MANDYWWDVFLSRTLENKFFEHLPVRWVTEDVELNGDSETTETLMGRMDAGHRILLGRADGTLRWVTLTGNVNCDGENTQFSVHVDTEYNGLKGRLCLYAAPTKVSPPFRLDDEFVGKNLLTMTDDELARLNYPPHEWAMTSIVNYLRCSKSTQRRLLAPDGSLITAIVDDGEKRWVELVKAKGQEPCRYDIVAATKGHNIMRGTCVVIRLRSEKELIQGEWFRLVESKS